MHPVAILENIPNYEYHAHVITLFSLFKGTRDNLYPSLGTAIPSLKTPSDLKAVRETIEEIQEGLVNHNRNTAKVEIHTTYRGGSITKPFTTLVALQNHCIKKTDSVIEYLLQLKTEAVQNEGQFNFIPLDNITIWDLTSHLSGLGGDNLLTGLNNTPPLIRPNTTLVYFSIGLEILSPVVEATNNKTYEYILVKTFLSEPTWGGDLDIYASAGGIYTNKRDMLTFGAAILSSDIGINVGFWLKPHVFNFSRGYSISAPWEIWASFTLLESGVPVSFYIKFGDLGLSTNVLIIVPDYDLVTFIHATGAQSAATFSLPTQDISLVMKVLILTLEKASKESAHAAVAGTFTDQKTNFVH
ncbi:beta-lactamase [Colletotrichum graminicola]|uniref:Beta-lactamase n=1 Tax=Colletotrichum graminicola (strain M1.001 / M2 / FGSC 10212) TaxID=645133 RepID=E3QZV3_COLGM|nr:beta-lactamase [Colletotrichum graminicola M1.001]EFQ36391.1 beta-lactamase [Colletotrichum graminicola M1.001]WDK22458.1 beta-lactamase [Colletotrichum graminicola]